MFDYLQKYNKLPKELRDKMSNPAVILAIEELEKKYGFNLAATIMKVVVKDIGVNGLSGYLAEKFGLNRQKSEQLSNELMENVFANIADYLKIDNKIVAGAAAGSRNGQNKKLGLPIAQNSQSLFLQEEDEREIRELIKKTGQHGKASFFSDQINDKLESALKKIKINFGSESLKNRFSHILKIYIKGIRDRLETKQTLIKAIGSGGMEFDAELAEKVLSVVDGSIQGPVKAVNARPLKKISAPEDELARKIKSKKSETNSLENAGIRDVDYDFTSLKKKDEAAARAPDIKRKLAPPPPTLREPELSLPNPRKPSPSSRRRFGRAETSAKQTGWKRRVNAWRKQTENQAVPEAKHSAIIKMPERTGGKIRMEDVKFQPKIMGPIDELKYMSLVDFRRLDKDPLIAAGKIKEKINILGEEYSKRTEGIKAWRNSPVNKLYLKMGEASISRKKPIDVIIEERKLGGKEYLNNQEFEAVIKLNKALRF